MVNMSLPWTIPKGHLAAEEQNGDGSGGDGDQQSQPPAHRAETPAQKGKFKGDADQGQRRPAGDHGDGRSQAGTRLALAGIIAPVMLGVLGGVGFAFLEYRKDKRAATRMREAMREAEEARRDDMRRAEEREAWARIYRLWCRFHKLSQSDTDPTQLQTRLELLEPGWAEDYLAGKLSEA